MPRRARESLPGTASSRAGRHACAPDVSRTGRGAHPRGSSAPRRRRRPRARGDVDVVGADHDVDRLPRLVRGGRGMVPSSVMIPSSVTIARQESPPRPGTPRRSGWPAGGRSRPARRSARSGPRHHADAVASSSASSWSWVTKSAVLPVARRVCTIVAHLLRGGRRRGSRTARRRAGARAPAPARAPPRRAAAGRPRAGAGTARRAPRGRRDRASAARAAASRRGSRASPKPTLAPTVRCGNSAKSWKTTPTRSALRRPGPAASRDLLPADLDLPARAVSKPATRRSVVVFPQPEGPTSATISPLATLSERSSTAGAAFPAIFVTPARRSRLTLRGRRAERALPLGYRPRVPASDEHWHESDEHQRQRRQRGLDPHRLRRSLPDLDREGLEADRPEEQRRRQLLHRLDPEERAAPPGDRGAESGRCTRAEHTRARRAPSERAASSMLRGIAREAASTPWQRDREKPHEVREEDADATTRSGGFPDRRRSCA